MVSVSESKDLTSRFQTGPQLTERANSHQQLEGKMSSSEGESYIFTMLGIVGVQRQIGHAVVPSSPAAESYQRLDADAGGQSSNKNNDGSLHIEGLILVSVSTMLER